MNLRWALLSISLASCRCGEQPKPETRSAPEEASVQAVVAKQNAENAASLSELTNDLEEQKKQLQVAEERASKGHTGAEKAVALMKTAELRKKVADLQAKVDA